MPIRTPGSTHGCRISICSRVDGVLFLSFFERGAGVCSKFEFWNPVHNTNVRTEFTEPCLRQGGSFFDDILDHDERHRWMQRLSELRSPPFTPCSFQTPVVFRW